MTEETDPLLKDPEERRLVNEIHQDLAANQSFKTGDVGIEILSDDPKKYQVTLHFSPDLDDAKIQVLKSQFEGKELSVIEPEPMVGQGETPSKAAENIQDDFYRHLDSMKLSEPIKNRDVVTDAAMERLEEDELQYVGQKFDELAHLIQAEALRFELLYEEGATNPFTLNFHFRKVEPIKSDPQNLTKDFTGYTVGVALEFSSTERGKSASEAADNIMTAYSDRMRAFIMMEGRKPSGGKPPEGKLN